MFPESRSFLLLLFLLVVSVGLMACGNDSDAVDGDAEAGPTFTFEKGDSICLVGNALAERMQHHGWLETALQMANPGSDLSVWHLGFGADEVTTQQRTQGFTPLDQYLELCDASVVFCFFGENESFAGENGVHSFARDLASYVKHLQGLDINGHGAPRVVLFSCLPRETTGNTHLPDASAANQRTRAYSEAVGRVAAETGAFFVDLHPGMTDAMAGADDLTINGLHLNEAGNKALARVIMKGLGADFSADGAQAEDVRAAVVHKNELWFQRYRATDGYNVYGGRSSLKYTDDVSNYEVLQKEMRHLDELARRHTAHIRSLAVGKSVPVDLEGLPPLQPVKTNIPGPNPDGSHVFKSGKEAINDMKPGPGLEIQLFASEEKFPELVNPVQMSWDSKGRLWVAVWPTYPHWKPDEPMNDKLLILEDTDGDGEADSCKVFADGLHNPTGFEFWQGGVYVANAPDLLFLEDKDGDDVADACTRVIHGLSSADTHHAANSFVFGPDGALYFQEGTFHKSQIETVHGPVRNNNGCVWRFEPRTWRIERYVAYNFANPHGHVFDSWGQDFVTDGTGNQNYYALPFSGHVVHPDKHRSYGTFFQQRCRPAAATEMISSELFGPDFENDYLVANVIGFRGILRYDVQDAGSGFGAVEADPIVSSDDSNFRPSDLEIGPDGALYFLDWHNPIIGHMQHHLRDPNRDRKHGRVYRVAPKGAAVKNAVPLDGMTVTELVAQLRHPEYRVRYRARAELSGRPSMEVLAAAQKQAGKLGADDWRDRLELLWLHQQFDEVETSLLQACLGAPDHRVRAAAVRVVRGLRHKIPDAVAHLKQAAGDKHPRVRLEAVVGASFLDSAAAAGAALGALEQPLDRFLSYAMKETLRTLEPRWRAAIRDGDLVADTPKAQAFLLGQVEAEELSRLPRVPAVFRAELVRGNVPQVDREAALAALAKEEKRHETELLVAALVDVDKGSDMHKTHVMRELSDMLQARMKGAPDTLSAGLDAFARDAVTEDAGRIALAARVAAEGKLGRAWDRARSSSSELLEFLGMIPLLADETLRSSAWDRVRPIAFDARAVELAVDDRLLPGLDAAWYPAVPSSAADDVVRAMVPERRGRVDRIGLAPELIARPDGYAMRFAGQIRVPADGAYTFFTRSDDGSMLYIDGALVVDNDGPHGTVEKSGQVNLNAGLHDIVVTFFEQGGAQSLSASWAGPTFKKRQIESKALCTAADLRIREAAVLAMAASSGHQRQKLRDASRLIADGQLVDAALELVGSAGVEKLPGAEVNGVINSVAGWVSSLEGEQKTGAVAVAALDRARRLAGFLPDAQATAVRKRLGGLGGEVILIRTLPHQMLYDRQEIWVQAGKPVAMIFQNNDAMPHNLVVTKDGSLQTVGEAAEKLGPDDKGTKAQYVPDLPEVLWHTDLLKPGDSTRLTFTAPAEPCDLDFVCTFPGHYRVMNGVIHVVDDMEGRVNEVLADESCSGTPAREFVKDWTIEELQPAFQGPWRTGRSLDRGRRLFTEVGCAQCHRHGDTGDARYVDLTAIGSKYHAAELLSHIVDPSKSLLEGYTNTLFTLDSGRPLVGRIVKEKDGEIWVNKSVQDPDDIIRIKAASVKERLALKLSPMPTGLLVTMTQAEILDLVNFLERGAR